MESFQDLLSCVGATVLFSLLLSFVISKLLAMDSGRDRTPMSKPKGESLTFDWICKEQSDGILLDHFSNVVDMKSEEAYDSVEKKVTHGGGGGGDDDSFVDKVFDESPEGLEFCKTGKDDQVLDLDWEGGWAEEDEYDHDWEGVERSDLEKRFGDAMIFVGCMNNASNIAKKLDNDDKLQLYLLGMIVLEGPYILPQPMTLKVSSQVKWNAMQELRHMDREMAMNQYISLLSKNFPDWSDSKNMTNVS